jgi:hypothetical protein
MPNRNRNRLLCYKQVPNWVLQGNGVPASLDFNFAQGLYYQASRPTLPLLGLITTTRTSTGTNLLPTSPSGFAYTTFANNIPRTLIGSGLIVEQASTNVLLHSTAPATQTTGSLGTGSWTLWINGTGSATSSAGTATGTGFGAATQGSPNTFSISSGGTVIVTVSGSLQAFQLENLSFGTSFIITSGSTATRQNDLIVVTKAPVFGLMYSTYISGIPLAATSASTLQVALGVDDGTSNNKALIYRGGSASNNVYGELEKSGSVIWSGTGANWLQNSFGKAAMSLANSAHTLVFDAGSPVTNSTSGALPSPTAIHLGCGPTGGSPWNGVITRAAIWPSTALSLSNLTSVTNGSSP